MINNIKQAWFSFWYAIAFLTRIPAVNLSKALTSYNKKIGQGSLYFYPVVGLIIGSLMCVVYFICAWQAGNSYPLSAAAIYGSGFDSSNLVIAALILLAWCLVTGGLHLDGLADAADAWVGGYGDKQRTLDIMKDPTIGPMGAMLVVVVLLLKFAALVVVVDKMQGFYLIGAMLAVPMLARFSILPLFYFTPYVREKGLGSDLKQSISPLLLMIVTVITVLLTVVFLQQKSILILILSAAILLWARNIMMQRIGGTTGDTAGALIEVQEALLLCALVL
ncbi:MAG: adenosylcobinamide-GDP ribazoletransferase [Oleispira antarctica]|nr:adenosylcobinamide-GDP ribazoletransferase [Oleispira antarctica]MBQ0791961.1 adenosylcobinamide-GDP ribazoletransferase [Oleispira antarctica]